MSTKNYLFNCQQIKMMVGIKYIDQKLLQTSRKWVVYNCG